ncbi:MAG: sigma-70 family RNA polymerase sigma factor [Bacteroidetes bacterium]|nr:sigma-70 family RNA polymerase sigma factor [Bacteroidota bacterium]MBU1115141.1 sigma-70 family RNA polymerase sigma factor [Bacteroidota bacterium]MBU1799280.1 sigma-70 family RNA polymerase sigma factor [Bacteroidota bacterium]
MTSYKDISDIEIFEHIVKYDSKALEELYLRYSPILYSLIKKIVSDEKVSEQILLDVFTVVWKKIDLFSFKTGNVYTWMIMLTRNKAVEYLRNKGELAKEDDIYEDFYVIPILDNTIDSLSLNSAMKVKPEISEALDNLTDAQKYVLLLSFYEGLTLDQIAEKLNIPVPTVRSKITLALDKLRENLLGG